MAESDVEVWATDPVADSAPPSRLRTWGRRLVSALGLLKVRLTLGAVGCLAAGIAVISMLSLGQVERDLLRQAEGRGIVQSARLAAELSERVVAMQRTLRTVADQLEPSLAGDDEELAALLTAQSALVRPFTELFVEGPDGRLRVALDEHGIRLEQLGEATRTARQGLGTGTQPAVSAPTADPTTGEVSLVFVQPVVRGGRTVALVGGAVPLSAREIAGPLADEARESGESELLLLTDAAGRVIAHPQGDRRGTAVALQAGLEAAARDWAARGSPAEPTGVALSQPDGVVTTAGVAATGWVVWRAVAGEALTQPLRAARLQALVHAAVVMVVLGIAIGALVHRLLAPLRQLEIRARHLFDADRDIRDGWPTASGEVGELVHALRHVGAERVHLEAFTSELLGKLNSVMAAAPLGIAFTRDGRFELVSAAWCRMLQRSEWQLLGTAATDLLGTDEDRGEIERRITDAFVRDGEYVGEWQLRREDGSVFWGQLSARPVDPAQAGSGTIWTLADVTVSRASRESLEWSATHDPLTGLANRAAFESKLRAVAANPPAALIMIDLDRFKPINDTHGHAAGDAMLRRVAQAISAKVRTKDLAVRLGGDEFAVILEGCPPEAARRVAEDVQRAITAAEIEWDGQRLSVGASAGAVALLEATDSIEAWIAAADAACYEAKAAGRGTVRMAAALAPSAAAAPTGPADAVPTDAGSEPAPARPVEAAPAG